MDHKVVSKNKINKTGEVKQKHIIARNVYLTIYVGVFYTINTISEKRTLTHIRKT